MSARRRASSSRLLGGEGGGGAGRVGPEGGMNDGLSSVAATGACGRLMHACNGAALSCTQHAVGMVHHPHPPPTDTHTCARSRPRALRSPPPSCGSPRAGRRAPPPARSAPRRGPGTRINQNMDCRAEVELFCKPGELGAWVAGLDHCVCVCVYVEWKIGRACVEWKIGRAVHSKCISRPAASFSG
jgi:hypothetical protein